MRTKSVIAAEMTTLSNAALSLVNSTQSLSAKKGALDRLEADLKRLQAEMADVKHVDGERHRYNADMLGESDPGAHVFAAAGTGRRLSPQFAAKSVDDIGAPPLALDRKQVEDLFEAVQDRKALSIEMKSSTTDTPMATEPQFYRPVLPFARERTRVLDLMTVEPTAAPMVWWYKGTTGATAAAPVAEGATKPQSVPVYTRFVATVSKLAHWCEVTDEVIQDFSQFLSLIQEELLAGLIFAENDQLLNGTGVAPQQQGILTTTGIQTRAKGTETSLETLFLAATDLRTGSSFVEPDGIVLHPSTYQTIRLTKDSQGRYLEGTGDVTGHGTGMLWGVPVTLTTQIAAGTAIVANFAQCTKVWLRESPRIETNQWAEASWKANKTLVRCEERLAGVAVVRPSGVVKVTGL